MKKEECEFRKQAVIPGVGLTDPICTHKEAPFTSFKGIKDNFLCGFCVRNSLCPIGIMEP
jgi:hypothetical protein